MSVRRNIIANYVGQGWVMLMGIAFLPRYISYLGMEAYGLIGFYAIVQSAFTLLDLGLTPTLSREMAIFSSREAKRGSIHDTLRTLEFVSLSSAMASAAAIYLFSDWIATSWLRIEKISMHEASTALAIMGAVAGVRLLEGLYRGALIGLQKQIWLNGVAASMATLRWGGGLGFVVWQSSSIVAFFVWQLFVSVATVTLLAGAVYRTLPQPQQRPRFSWNILSERSLFTTGMFANTILALLLTQSDKVLLSKILSLEEFGYYTLAATIASMLLQIAAPICQAYYPQLIKCFTIGDFQNLAIRYHLGSQLVAIIIFPFGLMLALHGDAVLMLWAGEGDVVRHVAPILTFLVLGNMLHGVMGMPNALRLAYGWAWFSVKLNLLAVGILIPTILWVAPRYGAIGAAWVWFALNIGYVFLGVALMHWKVLPKEWARWFKEDFLLLLVVIAGTVLLVSFMKPDGLIGWNMLLFLVISGVLSAIAGILSSTLLRPRFIKQFIGASARRA